MLPTQPHTLLPPPPRQIRTLFSIIFPTHFHSLYIHTPIHTQHTPISTLLSLSRVYRQQSRERNKAKSMGQQSLIYSFVARGTVILSEFTEFTGNFTSIASQCLQKLPSTNNKFTYSCDGHTFNYLVQDGFSNLSLSLVDLGIFKCVFRFCVFFWSDPL